MRWYWVVLIVIVVAALLWLAARSMPSIILWTYRDVDDTIEAALNAKK